ncbi:glycosyltransferase family 2 protein [Piscicoccus intestinalis]|uniref:glycosyltransferase family 2 protein n=1 Tax=Piscicoccus intestinalis TaxID=746033 RepID=UPI000837ABDA|nr:glycosyltransferase [Piscicoccus intestinalis]
MSTSTGPSMAAVVCCYTMQRWDDTVAAVESLRTQQRALQRIVVVVDHNDELLARCRERWPEGQTGVTVLANEGRQGLSDGRNTGLRATDCDVVAFLDDDAFAEPDWSARLADCYTDPALRDVLGAGGYIEPDWPGGTAPTWWPRSFDWVVGCSYVGLPTRRTTVRNVIGANMSLRRDVALEVGGFNPSMGRVGKTPLGGEETEMYIRAAAARPGSRVVYEPAARVRHHVTPERATLRYFVSRCYGEGLTKAALSGITRSSAALSSESAYATKVLPVEFARGLISGDPRRGLSVALGLGVTCVGYARGLVNGARPEGGWSEAARRPMARLQAR